MTEKATEERIKRAMDLRDELFDLANSFAGEVTGDVAVYLHESCNWILRAKRLLDQQDQINSHLIELGAKQVDYPNESDLTPSCPQVDS